MYTLDSHLSPEEPCRGIVIKVPFGKIIQGKKASRTKFLLTGAEMRTTDSTAIGREKVHHIRHPEPERGHYAPQAELAMLLDIHGPPYIILVIVSGGTVFHPLT